MSRHLGLIIGVNHYRDTTFQPLQFAENDAKALAQWLVNTKGGKWSPQDVQLVQSQHVTKELIQSLLAQLCLKAAEAGDVILLYFGGHAFLDERSGEGYLALANTRYTDPTTAINIREFVQNLELKSKAAQIVCIFDCFQTGQMWSHQRAFPFDSKPLLGSRTLQFLQQFPDRLFLCSCRGNEFVPESGEHNLGLFTHRLILGLCGPASESTTGIVSLSKLHAYLFSTLSEQYRPQLFGQQKLPLILVGSPQSAESSVEVSNQHMPSSTKDPKPPVAGEAQASGFHTLRQSPQTSGIFTLRQTPQADVQPALAPSSAPSGLSLSPVEDEQRQQQSRQMLSQAQQFIQAQKYGDAFDLVDKVLQMQPNDTAALTMKGQLLGTAGHFADALPLVEQVLQKDTSNALAWSIRAVLLSNLGQHPAALASIERSLELDAHNPETYAIKTNIMANLAAEQSRNGSQITRLPLQRQKENAQDNARSFTRGAGVQILSFVVGLLGLGLLLLTSLPVYVGIALASFALAMLCVNAARDSFRYGFTRVLVTVLLSLVAGGILGIALKLGLERIILNIQAQPKALVIVRLKSFLFAGAWLATVAIVPLLASLVGLFISLLAHGRKR